MQSQRLSLPSLAATLPRVLPLEVVSDNTERPIQSFSPSSMPHGALRETVEPWEGEETRGKHALVTQLSQALTSLQRVCLVTHELMYDNP
jgi:hypothetical protein